MIFVIASAGGGVVTDLEPKKAAYNKKIETSPLLVSLMDFARAFREARGRTRTSDRFFCFVNVAAYAPLLAFLQYLGLTQVHPKLNFRAM